MKGRIIAVLVAGMSLIGAASASATVTISGTSSQIVLTSDAAGDLIHLRCQGGQAQSDSGNNTFSTTIGPCVNVQQVLIFANGGADNVQLQPVDAANFPNLPEIDIATGDDAAIDTVVGSQLRDRIDASSQDPIDAQGGNDRIDGGATVFGGPGGDRLITAGGTVELGPGDDLSETLVPGSLGGGPGFDRLGFDAAGSVMPDASSQTFTVTDAQIVQTVSTGGPPGSQTFSWSGFEEFGFQFWDGGAVTVDTTGFSGGANLTGGSGVETFLAGPGEDFLDGGANNDVIDGGPGFDYALGGAGEDQLRLRDGGPDRADCGDGSDTLAADLADILSGCETIDRPAPPDTAAPDTTGLSGPRKVKKGKKAKFTFSSSEAGATFMCAVDAAAFAPCSSPNDVKTKKLKPGDHLFAVFAVDAAGNADPSAARTTFTVRKKKPKKNQGG